MEQSIWHTHFMYIQRPRASIICPWKYQTIESHQVTQATRPSDIVSITPRKWQPVLSKKSSLVVRMMASRSRFRFTIVMHGMTSVNESPVYPGPSVKGVECYTGQCLSILGINNIQQESVEMLKCDGVSRIWGRGSTVIKRKVTQIWRLPLTEGNTKLPDDKKQSWTR